VDCSECRDEVDVDRNENLKRMIRKYFEQEQSIVEAQTKEVIIILFICRIPDPNMSHRLYNLIEAFRVFLCFSRQMPK
jgi:hypothetical protein